MQTVKRFIAAAEEDWLKVFYSGKRTKFKSCDGAPIYTLHTAVNTRGKIYKYFCRRWGVSLAKAMMCSLPLTSLNGKTYVIRYDFPPMSIKVASVKHLWSKPNTLCVGTVLSGGPEGRVRVTHVFTRVRRGARYVITQRRGPQYDFRYYSKKCFSK